MNVGVLRICDTLEKANHVFNVGIPERISKETFERFNAVMSSNKPKKGKKGKGKKKKKWKGARSAELQPYDQSKHANYTDKNDM